MIRLLSLFSLLFVVSGSVWAAEVPEILKGTWKINHDASMELMKTSPKYDEANKDMLSRSIVKREPIMRLEVTASSVEVKVGERGQAIPFTVVSSTENEVATKAKVKDNEFDLDLKLIHGKYLQMISSASDDMNFFAWEKI